MRSTPEIHSGDVRFRGLRLYGPQQQRRSAVAVQPSDQRTRQVSQMACKKTILCFGVQRWRKSRDRCNHLRTKDFVASIWSVLRRLAFKLAAEGSKA